MCVCVRVYELYVISSQIIDILEWMDGSVSLCVCMCVCMSYM